ncbi:putative pyruvate dehydrogenase [Nemania diffusa]|nr:putative pyruvate dehydrogenase [Nemania diffusa]
MFNPLEQQIRLSPPPRFEAPDIPREEPSPLRRGLFDTSLLRGPSEEDVTNILSDRAYSYSVRTSTHVTRYESAQLPGECPCEQRLSHGKFPSPYEDDADWLAWGVFDGHDGQETAQLLEKFLIPSIRKNLEDSLADVPKWPFPNGTIQNAIKKAFTDIDDAIIIGGREAVESDHPPQDKIGKLAPCRSGSCALVALFIPKVRSLFVACTGDTRAVIGEKFHNHFMWSHDPLSTDQVCSNESEMKRIQTEHGGELIFPLNGLLCGSRVTRSFGDARYKWPMDVQLKAATQLRGRLPIQWINYLSPPYLTAMPVITRTTIDHIDPTVMIIATQGFWKLMDTRAAVESVETWWRRMSEGLQPPTPIYEPFHFGYLDKGYMEENFIKSKATVQDENLAVHLLRNALGGNHHELIASRLAYSAPYCSQVRDEMTVLVVFFNTQRRAGELFSLPASMEMG